MALDPAYFDTIQFEVVKKKYYNAKKVDAALEDIRLRAGKLNDENEQLRRQLAQLSGRKEEIVDTLLSAKSVAQQILQESRQQGDEIVAKARQRAEAIEAEAADRLQRLKDAEASAQEETVRLMEACYGRMRERLLGCVDDLNADWQDYLCSLGGEPDAAPADLDEKVGAIARALFGEDEITSKGIDA